MSQRVEVVRLKPKALLPQLKEGGYEIYAHLTTEAGNASHKIIPPNNTIAIPTGICLRAPLGVMLALLTWSGLARRSVFVADSPSILRAYDTGELEVLLYNGGFQTWHVHHQAPIARIVALHPIDVSFTEVVKSGSSS